MDLKDGWEKKALIGVGVLVVVIIFYIYFIPYYGTPTTSNTTQNTSQVSPSPAVPIPYSQQIANNGSSSNNSTISGNFSLSATQAQNIALNANQGYSAGTPTQGNVAINGTAYSVWIVPITKTNTQTKTVYVDATSGSILQTN